MGIEGLDGLSFALRYLSGRGKNRLGVGQQINIRGEVVLVDSDTIVGQHEASFRGTICFTRTESGFDVHAVSYPYLDSSFDASYDSAGEWELCREESNGNRAFLSLPVRHGQGDAQLRVYS
ncbi:hypothetical protein GF386_02675 [Candidatus Pacearchaeota archaeon]|nr:hypothetical protein [Candidatus Pacearchaeota archaeon]MBD3283053.1 hypothetical protein [Candidatus Pacearchaeota archaeon]